MHSSLLSLQNTKYKMKCRAHKTVSTKQNLRGNFVPFFTWILFSHVLLCLKGLRKYTLIFCIGPVLSKTVFILHFFLFADTHFSFYWYAINRGEVCLFACQISDADYPKSQVSPHSTSFYYQWQTNQLHHVWVNIQMCLEAAAGAFFW